jgi:Skp family chaperone for outer membrane proteins
LHLYRRYIVIKKGECTEEFIIKAKYSFLFIAKKEEVAEKKEEAMEVEEKKEEDKTTKEEPMETEEKKETEEKMEAEEKKEPEEEAEKEKKEEEEKGKVYRRLTLCVNVSPPASNNQVRILIHSTIIIR